MIVFVSPNYPVVSVGVRPHIDKDVGRPQDHLRELLISRQNTVLTKWSPSIAFSLPYISQADSNSFDVKRTRASQINQVWRNNDGAFICY